MNLKNKSLLVIIILFLSQLSFLSVNGLKIATNKNYYQTEPEFLFNLNEIIVPDDYKTIQSAIDNANNYDTIRVRSGVYKESIIIDKTGLKVIGEDPESTIIDGCLAPRVVEINTDEVKISGFTIRNGGPEIFNDAWDPSALCIASSFNIISNNKIIENKWFGIDIMQPILTNRKTNYNIIYNNNVSCNGYHGILIRNGRNHIIKDNICCNNEGAGLFLLAVKHNKIISNAIKDNTYHGICAIGGEAVIFHNNFFKNTYYNHTSNAWVNSLRDYGPNIWYNKNEGNYWDDYNGADLDNNGIGDTPYKIISPGGGEFDLYPLMYEFNKKYNMAPETVKITGSEKAIVNNEIEYNVFTIDAEGDDVYYKIDWGDDTDLNWIGPLSSGYTMKVTHIWKTKGEYQIEVTAKDINGLQSARSEPFNVTLFNSNPPNKPKIPDGASEGSIGKEYAFSTSTTDPDNDKIYYLFDWGDGKNSEWIGPFESGETISESHRWSKSSSFYVRVKAKDINDDESEWSGCSRISVDKKRLIYFNLIEEFTLISKLIKLLKK